jgi:ABC-2 type transport system permease protein
VAIAAMAATLAAAITMQVLDVVPQLHAIHGLLISNYLLDFADVLRDPLSFAGLTTGCWVAVAYLVIFGTLAWARFTTKDISS